MLKKINRQDCLEQYAQMAHFDDENVFNEGGDFFYPKVFSSYNLTHKSKSFKAHVCTLATEVSSLMVQLGFSSLIFLPNTDTPWLKGISDNEPSQAAEKFFKNNAIGKKFNGGILLNEKLYTTFFKHLLWMIRSNEEFPIVHFTDKKQQIMACICSYGSLHLDILEPELDPVFQEKITHFKLEMIGLDSCASFVDTATNMKKRRHLRNLNDQS